MDIRPVMTDTAREVAWELARDSVNQRHSPARGQRWRGVPWEEPAPLGALKRDGRGILWQCVAHDRDCIPPEVWLPFISHSRNVQRILALEGVNPSVRQRLVALVS